MMKRFIKKIVICIMTATVMLGNLSINTRDVSAAVEPWSKNEAGQFVNGNGDILNGATMKGIDVSHHNGSIDWQKVAATDVDYAIIRCGYGNDMISQDDTYWKQNTEGCEKNNIPYGVYIYSYATTVEMAKSEANHVLRLIEGHTLNFPIYFDVEDEIQKSLTPSQLTQIINTFTSIIISQGYECGIYANLDWFVNRIEETVTANNNFFKWIAQYNNIGTTYTGVYQMWQCTDKGKVDGIYGDVDLNFWYGTVRDRSYNARNYSIKNEPVTEKPTTAPKKVTPPVKASISKLTKGKKSVKISIKKVKGAKGYQIQYSRKKSFKKKYTKTRITTKTKLIIKKLKSKKTYYFRVKAYKSDGKKKVFSKKWSRIKKVKVK